MNKTKKVAIVILFAVMMTCFTGCNGGCSTDNISEVETETSSVYSFVTSIGITINKTYYGYKDLACKTANYSETPDYKTSPHWIEYRDDRTLFLYELKNTDVVVSNPSENNHLFDLGLFSVDNKTGECTMLGLYKNVYPTYRFRGTEENIVFGTDKNNVILFYNGRVEVLNIHSKETSYSKQFFAEDEFRNHESERPNSAGRLPYNFTDSNDLLIYDGRGIKLYEYSNGAFAGEPIEIEYSGQFEYANNIDEIVYVYNYYDRVQESEYFTFMVYFEKYDVDYELIYDKKSKNIVSEEDLLLLLREEKAVFDSIISNQFLAGESIFTYKAYEGNSNFTITREQDGKTIQLDSSYFEERSSAYSQFVKIWKRNDTTNAIPIAAYGVGDKILVCCSGYTSSGSAFLSKPTPRFYFELDFENGDVYYAGFSEHGNYEAKNIIKN